MKYVQQKDGEWVEMKNMKRYYMKCCDCGLSHRMEFRMIKDKLQFRAWRLKKNERRP